MILAEALNEGRDSFSLEPLQPGRGQLLELEGRVVDVVHRWVEGERVHPDQHEIVGTLLLRGVLAFDDVAPESRKNGQKRQIKKFVSFMPLQPKYQHSTNQTITDILCQIYVRKM